MDSRSCCQEDRTRQVVELTVVTCTRPYLKRMSTSISISIIFMLYLQGFAKSFARKGWRKWVMDSKRRCCQEGRTGQVVKLTVVMCTRPPFRALSETIEDLRQFS